MPTSTPVLIRRPASKATPCTGKPFPVVAVPGAPPSRRTLFGAQEPLAEQLPRTVGGLPPAVGGSTTPPPEPPSERQSTRTPTDHGSRIGVRTVRRPRVVNGGPEAGARPRLAHDYLRGGAGAKNVPRPRCLRSGIRVDCGNAAGHHAQHPTRIPWRALSPLVLSLIDNHRFFGFGKSTTPGIDALLDEVGVRGRGSGAPRSGAILRGGRADALCEHPLGTGGPRRSAARRLRRCVAARCRRPAQRHSPLDIGGLPTYVLIDEHGQIRARGQRADPTGSRP